MIIFFYIENFESTKNEKKRSCTNYVSFVSAFNNFNTTYNTKADNKIEISPFRLCDFILFIVIHNFLIDCY